MELNACNALITGASRGLGRALAEELAGRGVKTVLVARDPDELEQAAAAIRRLGGAAHALAADVADPAATVRLAGAAAALVGPIDLLIHNASSLGPLPLPLLLDTSAEDFERVLQVNLLGPFRLSRAVVGGMALRGRGLVVHITSDAGVQAYPRWGAYGVSKAAFDHLARCFAAELEGTGVGFLTIDPGEMDTRMHADAVPDADRNALLRPEDAARRMVPLFERAHALPAGARLELAALDLAGDRPEGDRSARQADQG